MDTGIGSGLLTKIRSAEEFIKLYYESLDKERHQMTQMYMDNGMLVWNGNSVSGKENIQKYLQELPQSEHVIQTVDAQPTDESVSSTVTFMVQVAGVVEYQDNPSKPFQQTFMIAAQGDKWQITNDCFRLQD